MRAQEHQISFDEYAVLDVFPTPLDSFLNVAPTEEIQATYLKHSWKFHDQAGTGSGDYTNIMVSVSGGADSDRLIDIIERIGYPAGNVHYHYYNTGMEYRATIRHLDDLEQKYGIKIARHYANVPVAVAVKKYGVPVFSKQISQYIYRLQKHGFKWEDKPFEDLLVEYPNCKAALRWWCNKWPSNSRCNIGRRKWLKEYMVANPPDFFVSDFCCTKSKKETAHKVQEQTYPDLSVQGVRKAEGGARAAAYKSCFDQITYGCSNLRPLFWWKETDCKAYDETFGVCHSDAYTRYGLKRTGCACCPYGRYWKEELQAAKKYEPGLYAVAMSVFKRAYDYMLGFESFKRDMERTIKEET